jgi:hypothetical protein
MTRPAATPNCCTTPSAMCFSAVMFGLFYGAGLLLSAMWPGLHPFGDTLILTAAPRQRSQADQCHGLHGSRAAD